MSEKPELPSVSVLTTLVASQGQATIDGHSLNDMLRAQHAALREPWCKAVNCHRGYRVSARPCYACNGTGLNRRARAVLQVGEAAGLGEAKETP